LCLYTLAGLSATPAARFLDWIAELQLPVGTMIFGVIQFVI
jgi:hypothetical protein